MANRKRKSEGRRKDQEIFILQSRHLAFYYLSLRFLHSPFPVLPELYTRSLHVTIIRTMSGTSLAASPTLSPPKIRSHLTYYSPDDNDITASLV